MLASPAVDDDEPIEKPRLFETNGEPTLIEEDVCYEEEELAPALKPTQREEAAPIPWTESERNRREQAEQGITVIANMSRDHQLIAWAQNERRFIKAESDILYYVRPYKLLTIVLRVWPWFLIPTGTSSLDSSRNESRLTSDSPTWSGSSMHAWFELRSLRSSCVV